MKEVLLELVKKVSRKSSLIALAMVLVYMIVITPNATLAGISVAVIAGLAIFGVVVQFILDLSRSGTQKKTKKEEKFDSEFSEDKT